MGVGKARGPRVEAAKTFNCLGPGMEKRDAIGRRWKKRKDAVI